MNPIGVPSHAMKAPALLALFLTACSSLDPNVGPPYTEPPTVSDAGDDTPDAEPDGSDAPPGTVSFERDIRPIIMRTRDQAVAAGKPRGCVPCHLPDVPNNNGYLLGGFDVSSLGELRKGGGSSVTRIIVPYKPDESVMVRILRGQFGSSRMPKGSAPEQFWSEESEEMRLLTTWILEGARGAPNE